MREAADSSLGHWQGLQPYIAARPTLLGAKRIKSLLVCSSVTLHKSSGLSRPWFSHTAHGNNAFHPVPCKILMRTNDTMNSPEKLCMLYTNMQSHYSPKDAATTPVGQS